MTQIDFSNKKYNIFSYCVQPQARFKFDKVKFLLSSLRNEDRLTGRSLQYNAVQKDLSGFME